MTKKAIARMIENMTDEVALRLIQSEKGLKVLPQDVEIDADTQDIARTLVGRSIRQLRCQLVDAAAPLAEGHEDPTNGESAKAASDAEADVVTS